MKLIELQIQNVRGIRDLTLKLDRRNLVVWGANGSGKSAIVDSIDFLFTGKISRLTGSGTNGITLAKHGPHVDQAAVSAKVRALLWLPGIASSVEISRCFANPNVLECPETVKAHLGAILSTADPGQYVLTRREILRYIIAEPSSRAKQIQDILKLSKIEDTRKTLVKVRNDCKTEEGIVKQRVDAAKGAINATIQQTHFKVEKVLSFINENRRLLGGSAINNIEHKNVKLDIASPVSASAPPAFNITMFEKDLDNLRNPLEEIIVGQEKDLHRLISEVCSSPSLEIELSRHMLTKIGSSMLDETGKCPLCDYPWPEGVLQGKLNERIKAAETAEKYQQDISQSSEKLSIVANKLITSIANILKNIEKEKDLVGASLILREWAKKLGSFAAAVSDPFGTYISFRIQFPINDIFDTGPFLSIDSEIRRIVVLKAPAVSAEQLAWDALTRIVENLKAYELANGDFVNAALTHKRSKILLECFGDARDKALGSLYDEIRDRLVELYSCLHEEDEKEFKAKLEPDGAGLLLEVDFHGRGLNPPHAFHSEGHQDSMGLCLYLALAEKLTAGAIDLVVLDDVVMSVDSGHRKALCKMLATKFPGKQFLITTHDKTWSTQLRTEGIVTSKGAIEFFNWHVDSGPCVNYEVDLWDRIYAALDKEDVSGAAQLLRRGSEQFFAIVSDKLRATVTFKLSGHWELGDYLPAAYSRYQDLLKKAKAAANSWGNSGVVSRLNELESIAKQIYSRSTAEQWGINASVHYNSWANLSKEDFLPIAEAFHDLHKLFSCSSCEAVIFVSMASMDCTDFRCNCGSINWNLKKK